MSEHDFLFELKCLQRSSARKRFRKDIFDAWDGCAYCGSDRATTLDHVRAKAKGGTTTRSNLVSCCPSCNLCKSDQDWFSWYRCQKFWSSEREERLLHWLHRDHTDCSSSVHYDRVRRYPLQLSSSEE